MDQVKEADVEKYIMQKTPPQAQGVIKRVYLAGMQLLFSKQTHAQMLQEFQSQLQQGHDIGSVLGTDMVHIMLILYQESKNTMPPGALIPAGTMLLAKVAEFLNDSGTAQVTSADFAQAVHMMTAVLKSKAQGGQSPQAQPTGMMGG